MDHEVLISYSNPDRDAAERIGARLEAAAVRCWIAPRDIRVGANWGAAIVEAIEATRVVVVVVSSSTFESKHVAREVERADSKDKILIPFLLEGTTPSGPLEYYLGATQQLEAFPGPLDSHIESLVTTIRRELAAGPITLRDAASASRAICDEDLVALGRSICWDLREELGGAIEREEGQTVAEPKHGQQVKFIDLACNRRARRAVDRWQRKHDTTVLLAGEDLAQVAPGADRPSVICCLDSLDGTQHWLRGRNLYCTALSLFLRDQQPTDRYRLRVSLVQNADETLYVAREDTASSTIDGRAGALRAPASSVTELSEAQVCTVCRRPDHFRILTPHLARGVPFSGLYTFGGNPILTEITLGHYDAVFQPDASKIGDTQAIWDWLPGGHIAYRAGCTILDLDGADLDVVAAAEAYVEGRRDNFPYVASTNRTLAQAIVAWLAAD